MSENVSTASATASEAGPAAINPSAAANLPPPVALEMPMRVPPTPAWNRNLPLSFSIRHALKPATPAQLRPHMGNSYLAFCQAVQTLGIATRCYAVDTWRGDEHAGRYDDTVLRELQAYHDPLYGHFSRLVRSTFDQAVEHFEDGGVDLLHIDG